jgi:hypothetical protein
MHCQRRQQRPACGMLMARSLAQVCGEPGTKRCPLKMCTGRKCGSNAHMACLPGKGVKGSWRCVDCLDLTTRL